MRFTIDSNILVYALDAGTPEKQAIASDILLRGRFVDAVLTAQALAEFLTVVRRKNASIFSVARAEAARWAALFPVAATTWEHVAEAAMLAQRHRLQLWDCVIWQAARSLQATLFLSEDMQDGFSMNGMTVLDPFAPANANRLADLLERAEDPS